MPQPVDEDIFATVKKITNVLGILTDKSDFISAARIGKPPPKSKVGDTNRPTPRPRPIMIAFSRMELQLQALELRHRVSNSETLCPKPHRVYLNPDEPRETRECKGKLRKIHYHLRGLGYNVSLDEESGLTILGAEYPATYIGIESIPSQYKPAALLAQGQVAGKKTKCFFSSGSRG